MKAFLEKIRQVVSGRLLILKKKINKETLQKHLSLLQIQLEILWIMLKMKLQQGKGWLLDKTARLRHLLDKETLLLHYKKACHWTRTYLNREALKGYTRTAARWLRELPEKLTWENIKKCAIAGWNWLCTLPGTLRALRKNALAMSCLLLALWLFLGTATSMAWLTDTTPVERNSFTVGEMKLEVRYKNDKVPEYTDMNETSVIFNDEALYEPGYTQVVYLEITNAGNVDFDYQITVKDFDSVDSTNVYGQDLHLPKYLRFGVVTARTEPELQRKLAQQLADKEMIEHFLGEYSEVVDNDPLTEENPTAYAALIVFMPEETGNEANYKKCANPPQVILGVSVYAQQAGTMGLE